MLYLRISAVPAGQNAAEYVAKQMLNIELNRRIFDIAGNALNSNEPFNVYSVADTSHNMFVRFGRLIVYGERSTSINTFVNEVKLALSRLSDAPALRKHAMPSRYSGAHVYHTTMEDTDNRVFIVRDRVNTLPRYEFEARNFPQMTWLVTRQSMNNIDYDHAEPIGNCHGIHKSNKPSYLMLSLSTVIVDFIGNLCMAHGTMQIDYPKLCDYTLGQHVIDKGVAYNGSLSPELSDMFCNESARQHGRLRIKARTTINWNGDWARFYESAAHTSSAKLHYIARDTSMPFEQQMLLLCKDVMGSRDIDPSPGMSMGFSTFLRGHDYNVHDDVCFMSDVPLCSKIVVLKLRCTVMLRSPDNSPLAVLAARVANAAALNPAFAESFASAVRAAECFEFDFSVLAHMVHYKCHPMCMDDIADPLIKSYTLTLAKAAYTTYPRPMSSVLANVAGLDPQRRELLLAIDAHGAPIDHLDNDCVPLDKKRCAICISRHTLTVGTLMRYLRKDAVLFHLAPIYFCTTHTV